MYSFGTPHMAVQKQDDQHEHTFSNYVRIQDVVLRTCLGWWTIGRSGERESGISVLVVWHDDDDDDDDVNHICLVSFEYYNIPWNGALNMSTKKVTSLNSSGDLGYLVHPYLPLILHTFQACVVEDLLGQMPSLN